MATVPTPQSLRYQMLFFRLFRRSFIPGACQHGASSRLAGPRSRLNTVLATVAGSGSVGVPGYTVSSVVYNLNASNRRTSTP
jgi:hypothetical protein